MSRTRIDLDRDYDLKCNGNRLGWTAGAFVTGHGHVITKEIKPLSPIVVS
jgi:hypothetical protein